MRLGNAELEPAETDVSLSTLTGREKFASLIYYYHQPAIDDLLRLYNQSGLPNDRPEVLNDVRRDYLTTLFLHHLFIDEKIDLARLGMGENVCCTPVVELLSYLRSKDSGFGEEIQRCRTELTAISSSYTEDMIRRRALDLHIPTLHSAATIDRLAVFSRLVIDWSERWHLADEWCLDLALNAIKSFVNEIFEWHPLGNDEVSDRSIWWRNESFRSQCVNSAWNDAVGSIRHTEFAELMQALPGIPENPIFDFYWAPIYEGDKRSFRIRDRFTGYSSEKKDFKKRVEQELWFKFFSLYGESPGVLIGKLDVVQGRFAKLLKLIDTYLKKCDRVQDKHGRLRKSKPSGDVHFRWTVLFQVAGLRESEIVMAENDKGVEDQGAKNRENTSVSQRVAASTVRGGINDVAQLISLTLRSGKRGRPKGRKDSKGHHRHRVSK